MIHSIYNDAIFKGNYKAKVYAYFCQECYCFSMQESHCHDWMEIMYVLEGKCVVEIEDNEFVLKSGDYLFIDIGVHHKMTTKESWGCKMMDVEFGYIMTDNIDLSVAKILTLNYITRFFLEEKCSYLLIQDHDEMNHIVKSTVHELAIAQGDCHFLIQLLFAQLIYVMARQAVAEKAYLSYTDEHVKKAVFYIRNKYDNQLSVEMIANEVNIHPSYLFRIFKRDTGMTVNEYLCKTRIEKSKELLVTTNIPVIDISCCVGFNSRQYSSFVFKKMTGETPCNYRKSRQTVNRTVV